MRYQVSNLDGSLRQEDQTGHEIVDHTLQAKTNTDGERPSQLRVIWTVQPNNSSAPREQGMRGVEV
jgi:hypothetical protein